MNLDREDSIGSSDNGCHRYPHSVAEPLNTDTRPTLPSTDQLDTIPSFAAELHAPQIWRQVCTHLDAGDLLALAELLAVGITRNEQIAESTGWSLETVTVNRAHLDKKVIALGPTLSFD